MVHGHRPDASDEDLLENVAEHLDRTHCGLGPTALPFSAADRAFELALTPGAAEKVVVTFDA